jgi:selenide,water dikinase
MSARKLTAQVKAGGCASKLSPKLLDQALGRVPWVRNPNVLVGFETADDAGVYRLTSECALVQTVDFFTPVVDDPRTFGAIAAANALSDVYAMGGTPLAALSIVAFPAKGDIDDLVEIMSGGAEKMAEAGCAVIGGHSVADEEIKFGYAVTGVIDPAHVLRNTGARAGDALLFTKRIGTGAIATALKRGLAEPAHVEESIRSMLQLNRAAGEAMRGFDVHGCTDVSGFGLVGHAREMALGSGITIEIDAASIGFLPGALDYARHGAVPGGQKNNFEFASCAVEITRELAPGIETLLYDPQTSGGLLIALAEAEAAALAAAIPGAYRIGHITGRNTKPIRIV